MHGCPWEGDFVGGAGEDGNTKDQVEEGGTDGESTGRKDWNSCGHLEVNVETWSTGNFQKPMRVTLVRTPRNGGQSQSPG